eukprot:TRINITY_DN370_c1_g1_i1.p1 TRINITY_DN370_c1_g1~~TRINITY_DN370_c1_g1_i1.p1  ORF type:complete len:911 (-),score=387.61 TRINITY_DN370_c1_g1_i1:315-2984(-)
MSSFFNLFNPLNTDPEVLKGISPSHSATNYLITTSDAKGVRLFEIFDQKCTKNWVLPPKLKFHGQVEQHPVSSRFYGVTQSKKELVSWEEHTVDLSSCRKSEQFPSDVCAVFPLKLTDCNAETLVVLKNGQVFGCDGQLRRKEVFALKSTLQLSEEQKTSLPQQHFNQPFIEWTSVQHLPLRSKTSAPEVLVVALYALNFFAPATTTSSSASSSSSLPSNPTKPTIHTIYELRLSVLSRDADHSLILLREKSIPFAKGGERILSCSVEPDSTLFSVFWTSNSWELLDFQGVSSTKFSTDEVTYNSLVKLDRHIPGFIMGQSKGSVASEPSAKTAHSLVSAPVNPFCNTAGVITTFISKSHFAIIGKRTDNFQHIMVWDTTYGGIVMKQIVPMNEQQLDQVQAIATSSDSGLSLSSSSSSSSSSSQSKTASSGTSRIAVGNHVLNQVVVSGDHSWIAIRTSHQNTTQISISPLHLDSASLSSVIGSVSQSVDYLAPRSTSSAVAKKQSVMPAPTQSGVNLLSFLNRVEFGVRPPRVIDETVAITDDATADKQPISQIKVERSFAYQWKPHDWNTYSMHTDAPSMKNILAASSPKDLLALAIPFFEAHAYFMPQHDTKVKDSFKAKKNKEVVMIPAKVKELLKKEETRYKVADQFAHDLVLKALQLSAWDLFPFLFRTNTLSASMFPQLLPTLIAKDLTVLVADAIKYVQDVPENQIVEVLKYFLVSETKEMKFLKSRLSYLSSHGLKPDLSNDQYLNLVIARSLNTTLMAHEMNKLTVEEVQQLLTYLRKWLKIYGQVVKPSAQLRLAVPPLANIIAWTNLVLDSRLIDFLLSPSLAPVIVSLQKEVSAFSNTCSSLVGLKGTILHIGAQSPKPPRPCDRVPAEGGLGLF